MVTEPTTPDPIAIFSMPTEISQLVAALSATDPAERSRAVEQLLQLGHDARAAAVSLVRACGDESEEVRERVVAALEELGPPLSSDLQTLCSLLNDANADVGYWAATLIGRVGPDAASAVSALAAVVAGAAEMPLRERAVWALGKIGPTAAAALDSLRQAAAIDQPRLARLAKRAIEQIGGPTETAD